MLDFWKIGTLLTAAAAVAQDVSNAKTSQLESFSHDSGGQVETTGEGVQVNTTKSLRAGPRGYNLLEDTSVRKKLLHFDRERAPERVVHALGSGAFGEFESYGDWSNLTMACWLQEGAFSEVFTRFSVVVASLGGSENARDTHGFATKIYSGCGNQDLVGNNLPSFFINDGASFPDLVHAVKAEPNTGFPTGGSAHTTAFDFFNQHPEGAMQLMTVLSDLGIPRDARHISGNGVHTFRFINAQGESQLFKWYWLPMLGHRSLIYDEATTLAGKNNDFFRVDLYRNIAAGNFPSWELAVQIFPDDGTFMYNGYDLLIPTQIVPFEEVPLTRLGKMTLNRNIANFFAETESISFAPSNVVNGVSFVPDPLLQWRLMSYDDTSTHRHNSPNGYLLPINKPIAPINNNYRDGYMQPLIELSDSTSTPNTIDGVVSADENSTLAYTGMAGESPGSGPIGRFTSFFDWFGQARTFWSTLNPYAKQHTVDAYRFELGNVANPSVAQSYIDQTLNSIDNCLARRVAYGIGATLPALGSGPSSNVSSTNAQFPSLFPLNPGQEPNKSLAGLDIAVIANDTLFSVADFEDLSSVLVAQNVTLTVVGPRVGTLDTGVNATASFVGAASVFYDAVIIGSSASAGPGINSTTVAGPTSLDPVSMAFVQQAYSHGKAIGALGDSGDGILMGLGFPINETLGVYSGAADEVVTDVMQALMGPVRFYERFPTDDLEVICS